jgi:hypothetical protein
MSERDDHTFDFMRPYDDSMWDHFDLYDNMPYRWSSDEEKRITLISGNLIKSYRYKVINEPYIIKN